MYVLKLDNVIFKYGYNVISFTYYTKIRFGENGAAYDPSN